MELKEDLFKVISTSVIENGFAHSLTLNAEHIIFKGHFPGHPVTPGVIQLQIIHELLEEHLGILLKLVSISSCKFLKVMDPIVDPLFELECTFQKTEDLIKVKATGRSGLDNVIKLESVYTVR